MGAARCENVSPTAVRIVAGTLRVPSCVAPVQYKKLAERDKFLDIPFCLRLLSQPSETFNGTRSVPATSLLFAI
jgi:hypothetical protein